MSNDRASHPYEGHQDIVHSDPTLNPTPILLVILLVIRCSEIPRPTLAQEHSGAGVVESVTEREKKKGRPTPMNTVEMLKVRR